MKYTLLGLPVKRRLRVLKRLHMPLVVRLWLQFPTRTRCRRSSTLLKLESSRLSPSKERMQNMIAWTTLRFAEGRLVTAILSIAACRNDKGLDESQEAWHCRDKGFNAVWMLGFGCFSFRYLLLSIPGNDSRRCNR